jgi:DNA invertase Pin-like site-specific DNA recombinase
VTPEGFPLGYEVLPGNTSDKTTLRDILQKIEAQYGGRERAKARCVRFGRPKKLTAHQRREAIARINAGEAVADVARTFGVNRATYRLRQSDQPLPARESIPRRVRSHSRSAAVALRL